MKADQCRTGELMADDYFQHAGDCPSCEAYEAQRIDSLRGPLLSRITALEATHAALVAAVREVLAAEDATEGPAFEPGPAYVAAVKKWVAASAALRALVAGQP